MGSRSLEGHLCQSWAGGVAFLVCDKSQKVLLGDGMSLVISKRANLGLWSKAVFYRICVICVFLGKLPEMGDRKRLS